MTEVEDLQRRADELGDQLAELSDQASSKATRRLRVQLAALRRDLVAAWVALYGSAAAGPADPQQAAPFAATAIAALTEAMRADLVDVAPVIAAWLTAYRLGAESTGTQLPRDLTVPPLELHRPVAEQGARAVSGLTVAALQAQGFTAVTVALARAEHAVHRIEATTDYELTRAASTAVSAVAAERGASRIWISERDACPACRAYAGEVAGPGGVFPSGLTFGDRPIIPPAPLIGPPLHSHCRCVLQLHFGDEGVVTALKREARRSVLRGDLDASEPARLRAAGRLLAVGAGLPKTVEERAAAAVRRGAFNRRGPA